jgi:hypothetical protein
MFKSMSKRRSERIAVTLPVRWIRRPNDVETIAIDMNIHGMFLRTDEPSVLPGQLMQVEVKLPEGSLELFVIARFVGLTERGLGIGVEIFVMDDVARGKWANYYRALAVQRRSEKTAAVAAAR